MKLEKTLNKKAARALNNKMEGIVKREELIAKSGEWIYSHNINEIGSDKHKNMVERILKNLHSALLYNWDEYFYRKTFINTLLNRKKRLRAKYQRQIVEKQIERMRYQYLKTIDRSVKCFDVEFYE